MPVCQLLVQSGLKIIAPDEVAVAESRQAIVRFQDTKHIRSVFRPLFLDSIEQCLFIRGKAEATFR